jgi:hypothetical protein
VSEPFFIAKAQANDLVALQVVAGVDLEIRRGEVLALLEDNSAASRHSSRYFGLVYSLVAHDNSGAAAGRFGALDRHAADARIDPHDQSRFRVQNAYDRR